MRAASITVNGQRRPIIYLDVQLLQAGKEPGTMLTATKDLMLPTTVTGSWPRPRWYTGNLLERPYSTGLGDVDFREQHLDAVATVISDQELAGLDILTNGDYHLDFDLAGRSWFSYPSERLSGVSEFDTETTAGWEYP